MNYPYLLFDADNTLFDFDKANRTAFSAVCTEHDIPDTEENFRTYEQCNARMWAAFDRGEVTKDFLVVQRYRDFLAAIGLERSAEGCNHTHLTTLGISNVLLPQGIFDKVVAYFFLLDSQFASFVVVGFAICLWEHTP